MFFKMQIFAFRDRLRISCETSQIPDFFLLLISIFHTAFVNTTKLMIMAENIFSLKKVINKSLEIFSKG